METSFKKSVTIFLAFNKWGHNKKNNKMQLLHNMKTWIKLSLFEKHY